MSGSAQSTVLVVEDEVLVRLDLVDNLDGEGYLTYEAGNAADAIAILEMHPEIRVVITDIQMPGEMDGLQLSHYIRNRWPPTIIVVCSANKLATPDAMPTDASFMSKPYDRILMGQMLSRLGEQLAR